MQRLALIATFACVVSSGCTSSLRVRAPANFNQPFAHPKGLLFYSKVGVCKRQSVWVEPTYDVSYGDHPIGPVNHAGYVEVHKAIVVAKDEPALRTLVEKYPPMTVDESVKDQITGQEDAKNWLLLSNTGDIVAKVDYGHPLYLNSGRPLAGTTQVTGKLAEDGTLTEATANVQDQSIQAVASLLTAITGLTHAGMAAIGDDSSLAKVTPHLTLHTHTEYKDLSGSTLTEQLKSCLPKGDKVYAGSWTVTSGDIQSSAQPAEKTPKTNGTSAPS